MTTLEKLDQISERIVTYIDKDFELYILEQALDLLEEVKRELGDAMRGEQCGN
jgi:actin-like ATPase involved in cell morphogenesis